jgi:hypothetical protein
MRKNSILHKISPILLIYVYFSLPFLFSDIVPPPSPPTSGTSTPPTGPTWSSALPPLSPPSDSTPSHPTPC